MAETSMNGRTPQRRIHIKALFFRQSTTFTEMLIMKKFSFSLVILLSVFAYHAAFAQQTSNNDIETASKISSNIKTLLAGLSSNLAEFKGDSIENSGSKTPMYAVKGIEGMTAALEIIFKANSKEFVYMATFKGDAKNLATVFDGFNGVTSKANNEFGYFVILPDDKNTTTEKLVYTLWIKVATKSASVAFFILESQKNTATLYIGTHLFGT